MREKKISIQPSDTKCNVTSLSPLIIIENIIDSSWGFCAQEYMVVIGSAINSLILLRYSTSTFAIYEFAGLIWTITDTFFEAIRRPLLNVIAEDKYYTPETIGHVMQSIWLLSCLVAIPVMLFWCFAVPIFTYFGIAPTIVANLSLCIVPFVLSIIPNAVYDADIALLYAMQDKSAYMLFSLLSTISFLALNYFFVYGLISPTVSGVFGLAFANLIYILFNLLAIKLYLFYGDMYQQLCLFQLSMVDLLQELTRCLSLTIGPFVSALIKSPVAVFLQVMLGRLGELYIVLNGIVSNIYQLLLPLISSIMLGTSVKISECHGQKKYVEARVYGNYGLVIVASLSILLTVGVLASHSYLLSLFMDVSTFQSIGGANTALFFLLLCGINSLEIYILTCLGNLSAYKDTLIPTTLNAVTVTIVGLSLAYCAVVYFKLGIFGLYGAMLLANIISAACLTVRWVEVSHSKIANTIEESETASNDDKQTTISSVKCGFWSGTSDRSKSQVLNEDREVPSDITFVAGKLN